ncbi:MAG: endonuclease/exonuclease/phosphatase family protein, partial [Clostridia bacterium]|nr:endonuclease/exonuclease/phosphatase family protein [Clostridia bacterium]
MSKKLLSWNVNGIRAVAKKGFLEIASELDADILCLQETRAFPEQIPAAVRDMQGYHSYFVAAER